MKYVLNNKTLNMFLTEAAGEYKDLLLEKTMNDLDTLNLEGLTPMDLSRTDYLAKEVLRTSRNDMKRKQIIKMLFHLSVAYSFVGMIIVLFSEYSTALQKNPISLIGLIVASIGMLLTLICLVLRDNTNLSLAKKNNRENLYQIMIINRWNEMDSIIATLLPDSVQISQKERVHKLRSERLVTQEEEDLIWWLIEMRNKIVHGVSVQFDEKTYLEKMAELNRVIKRLSKSL